MKLALVAILICASTLTAAAAGVTLVPNDVGNVTVSTMGSVVGTLTDPAMDNVDLDIGTCSGAGNGTFSLNPSSAIHLNTPQLISIGYLASSAGFRMCQVAVRKHTTGNILATLVIQATGVTPPMISVADPPSFGAVRFNDAALVHSSTQTIVVTNTGGANLNVTTVSIGGASGADFSITSGGSNASIPSLNTHQWMVTFNPSAAGTRTATMIFASDDPVTPTKVINLSGIGTNAIINLTATIDFAIVNEGNSSSRDDTVTNVGVATKGPLGVSSATIGNIGGVGGVSWFTFTSCSNLVGATCNFTPALSILNSIPVALTCSPPTTAAVNDTQTATVTFASDSDVGAAGGTNLSCTAGKSTLTTTSLGVPIASVGFANTLVSSAAPTQPVTITNTGNVVANVTFSISGSQGANFSIASACGTGVQAPCVLAASGGQVTVNVGFAPVVEGGIGATLIASTSGVSPSLALSGRGIDRHISFAPMTLFPDTFRYPGSLVVPTPVTIMNTGEAPLHVSGLVVGDAPIWANTSATSFDVPPLGSSDVMIAFSPISAGKQDPGRLMVMSDDRLVPTSMVILVGYGKDRDVNLTKQAIDLGDRSAGVPTRLSDLEPGVLMIKNNDAEATFHIREIHAEGDTVFEAQTLGGGSIANLELPPGSMTPLDIVFTPPAEGDFQANLAVYLDEDPTSQTSIAIRGRALTATVRGGGGCSATTGSGGMLLVLVLLLGLRLRVRVRHLLARDPLG